MDDLINNLKKLKETVFDDIMLTAKVEVENHVKEAFDNEGFTDTKLTKWQPVKRKTGGKILTKTRALADGLKVTSSGTIIKITSDLPYAEVHNEGGAAGRNGTAKIAKRQFVGKSKILENKLDKEITEIINKAFK